ncbi:hypothetical protein TQH59_07610 [Acinetobacter johnsonii]|uniref:hypothetical protein n=1 Tax=Acinetobacter johnsonii TaxID=40214 RepID=UPI002FDA44FF|nr:hypothetical protein TQH59_07565 [Acinetobacter johnsonii]WQN48764.1 hypothetical protein TQH59_07610 [Acinetobacter johnsonii]
MLKVALNTMIIMPVTGKFNDKDGKPVEFFQTTMLVPQVHTLSPSSVGSMPIEQIKAVLHQCHENSQEVEIEYSADGRDGKGRPKYSIYSVKPVPKKQP